MIREDSCGGRTARTVGLRRPRSAFAMLLGTALLLAACSGGDRTPGGRPASAQNPHGMTAAEPTTERSPDEGAGVKNGATERMSLREMVGQMFVVSVDGTGPNRYIEKVVRERRVGGVILFGYNMRGEARTRRMISSLQELSMKSDSAVPLFVAVDQEGGEVSHAPWVTPQPAAAEIGARGNPREARAVAETMGRELLRVGVNTDLAPVVDTGFGVAIDRRSFGENPRMVARMAAASVRGFEKAGVVSAAKHFPNHGPATTDSHKGLPVVRHDLEKIRGHDLPPFRAAVEAGVPMVMVGHLVYPAIDPDQPASLSPEAYRMLREDLGFDGVAVTDDLAMAGATGDGTPAWAAVRAVEAGADLLILSSPRQQQAAAYQAVVAAVESGEIPRSQIQDSVRRLIEVKKEYSLYWADEGR